MFSSSVFAEAGGFFDRDAELARLEGVIDKLARGVPKWLCLVGARKIGKTSLLREVERRSLARRGGPAFVVVDVLETLPVSMEVFREVALRAVEALLAREAGRSLAAAFHDPPAWRAALLEARAYRGLPPALQSTLAELPSTKLEGPALVQVLNVPERLAEALDQRVVVALDEFQELATLSAGKRGDVMGLLRSVWQRHRRTTYVVSGSARSTLLELAGSQSSPFFQHFEVMELGPFGEAHALALFAHLSTELPHAIDAPLARRAFQVVGGSPFYLQVIGEALGEEPGRADVRLRSALQRVLFSDTGRLALYFFAEFQRLVGRATTLAATLNALAGGPKTLTEVARTIGSVPAGASGYLDRLGDAVVRGDDGKWALADPIFGLWLQWRQPGGSVLPMKLVGDEAELAVAQRLAELGFELVYQSRGSRGAFDLIAARGASVLAVQVKRSPLPLRFSTAAWERMVSDGERYGWKWLVAQVESAGGKRKTRAVTAAGTVHLLDPTRAKRSGTSMVLDADAVLERPLDWFETRRKAPSPPRGRGLG
ncbi:MAG: AAA family ATPase [Myxococcaceae bacterium]